MEIEHVIRAAIANGLNFPKTILMAVFYALLKKWKGFSGVFRWVNAPYMQRESALKKIRKNDTMKKIYYIELWGK